MDVNTSTNHSSDDGSSSLLLRYQRSMSLDPSDEYYPSSMSIHNNNNHNHKAIRRRMIRSTACSIFFALVGWYYPRYLINHETTIATKQAPYQETAAGDVILDFLLNQPLVDPPTIPGSFLVNTSVWLPFCLVTTFAWIWYSKTTTIVHFVEVTTAISAFATSVGLCEGTTQLLKLYIQRKRPNYYALCAFDTTIKACTADLKHLREANFSFPSGHSSLSSAGMTFLVLYFCGKLVNMGKNRQRTPPQRLGGGRNNNNNGIGSALQRQLFLTAAIPWGWAIFVGASRLVDQWHHPSDVVAGLALGFITVTLVYHSWYPPVWSQYAGIPRSLLLHELEYANISGGSGSGVGNPPTSTGSNSSSSNNHNTTTTTVGKLPTFSD